MAKLNLPNQAALLNAAQPQIAKLKTALEDRRALWDKMSIDQKKKWAGNDNDKVFTMAFDLHKYLDEFFSGVNDA